ncbi:MAG: FAD-binding oxidoreductase, partial [Spirochaetaceae bacterium]
MTPFARFASERLRGDCSTRTDLLARHSTDMGIYSITPQAVVTPADAEDIATLLPYCSDARWPVTPRAGASNTGGAAVGRGVILLPIPVPTAAKSEPVTIVEESNDSIVVDVPAGFRHDRLQQWLSARGYHLPSDPSSGPLSFIGANVATRASGAHALQHGAIDRYLVSLRAVLADGTRIDTARPQTVPVALRDGLDSLARELSPDSASRERIEAKRLMKSASGYNLSALVTSAPEALDTTAVLNSLFAGSVGTLGVIEGVTLRCPRAPEGETLVVLSFQSETDACEAVEAVRESVPSACEILNAFCVEILAGQGVSWAESADALLVVEYAGDGHRDRADRARAGVSAADGLLTTVVIDDPDDQAQFWKLRKQMMLRLRNRTDHRAALSVVNDVGVPVSRLPQLLSGAATIFHRYAIPLPVYGHAADGNLHLRPLYDTADHRLGSVIAATAAETYELVLSLG